jgi:hypothetical protein
MALAGLSYLRFVFGQFSCHNRRDEMGWGAMMRAEVAAALFAASILGSSPAWSACPPGKLRNCVDLDLVPQISQQVVDGEHAAAPPKTPPPTDTPAVYTGPTLGAAANLRRAPTVGYRWSLD